MPIDLDGLSSTKIGLGLLYEIFHNLLHERPNTRDVFPYFGKIKFVDDAKLFFQDSSNIIQSLMKTCLLGSSQSSVTETIAIPKIYDKQKIQYPTEINAESRNICNSTKGLQTSKPSPIVSSGKNAPDGLNQDDVAVQSMAVSDWTNKLIDSAMKSVQPSCKLHMYLDASSDYGRKTASKSEGRRGVLIPALNIALCQIWGLRKQVYAAIVKVNNDGALIPKKNAS